LTSSSRILSIGDLDVDFYIAVPAIPGFDQKVEGRHLGQKPGGMAANFAVAAARLGRPVRLLAAVGDDTVGAKVLAQLAAEGVDLNFVSKRKGSNTFMCVILLSPSGEKSLIKLESDAYLPRITDLQSGAFQDIGHVHATYGSPDLTAKAFEMAGAKGLTTSLDLEPPDLRRAPQSLLKLLPLVDTLFLNRESYAIASNLIGSALHAGLLKPKAEIIITLGAEGCRRISDEGVVDRPGFKARPVDTTGAGDCFAAAYLARKQGGAETADALEFANAAAALATLDFGAQTAMPRFDTVTAFLRKPSTQTNITGRINA
jgi:ribokinase